MLPNPEEHYFKMLNRFLGLVDLSIKISHLNSGKRGTGQMIYASILFSRMCVIGRSTTLICHHEGNKIEHWDYISIFSQCRNLMECYHTFFYMCIDDVPEDELVARFRLLDLHEYVSRVALLSELNEKQSNESYKKQIIGELSKTSYFSTLDEKSKAHYLKGHNPFFISREEIEVRSGSDRKQFKGMYKLLSSNIHSYPLGYQRSIEQSRGVGMKTDIELHYSGLGLDLLSQYLDSGSKGMLTFSRRQKLFYLTKK